MFLSPIFFPLSSVPEPFRSLLYINPLTFIIDAMRGALFMGDWPNWIGLMIYAGIAWLVAWAGYAWFMRVRHGFADVV
jgi:lipopolysaccharide transport system permease protein